MFLRSIFTGMKITVPLGLFMWTLKGTRRGISMGKHRPTGQRRC